MKRKADLWRHVLCFSLTLWALAEPADATDVAQVPAPTGLYRVGTRTMYLVDSSRRDPFVATGISRELPVRLWYPSSGGQGCQPAPYASPLVWSYLAQLTGLSLPPTRTNSCQDAAITRGLHPVIVFSHGYTGMFTDETFLVEDLASRGYVIVSVAHSYETTAVELTGGRMVKSVFGSYLAPATARSDFDSLSRAFSVRLADLNFILSELQRLNTAASSPFAGNLDLARVAVMGHSLGGVVAIASLEQQPGIAAAVALDPILPATPLRATTRPVLIVAAGRERWSAQDCSLWNRLHGARMVINLRGADHFTPTDAVWLFDEARGVAEPEDTTGRAKTIAAIREYVAAFLETNLLGRPPRLLLRRPSPEFTDVAVTTSTQRLCPGLGVD